MKIKIETEDDLHSLGVELLNILSNLRYWTKKWEDKYGVYMKDEKKYWEKRADDYLDSLKVKKIEKNDKIEIVKPEQTI